MAQRLLRARVGAARINASMEPSQASYTRSIRSQMEQIEHNLTEVIRALAEETPEIIVKALRPTFRKSQRYVPVKTGELKASGYLEVKKSAAGATVEIGYGRGGHPNYAVWVHELTGYYHKPPTRAKFLQAALEEDMESIRSRLESAYRSMVD